MTDSTRRVILAHVPALVELLAEAERLSTELEGYVKERWTLRQGPIGESSPSLRIQAANRHRLPEILSVGTKARALLRQFWIALEPLDFVDNIRRELRRFEERIDEIDSGDTDWIFGFLTGLIRILRTACAICMAPVQASSTAEKSSAKQSRLGRPAAGEIDGEWVKAMRGDHSQAEFARWVGISTDVLQRAERRRASEKTRRKLLRYAKKTKFPMP